MNLNTLITNIQTVALSHDQVKSFHKGETFDVGTQKSASYPSFWLELPFSPEYTDRRKKSFTFAINVLTKAKSDDIDDQLFHTSDCEEIMDGILQALDDKYTTIGVGDLTGITLRNFSDDDLVGVRVDITMTIGRVCDYKNRFTITI